MNNPDNLPAKQSDILIYQTEDGRTRIEARMVNESVWLSLNQMASLFQRDKSVISRHIKNVFDVAELSPEAVVAEYATTAADGKTYQVDYYNLDMVISVGYRVKSHRDRTMKARPRSPFRASRTPKTPRTSKTQKAPRIPIESRLSNHWCRCGLCSPCSFYSRCGLFCAPIPFRAGTVL